MKLTIYQGLDKLEVMKSTDARAFLRTNLAHTIYSSAFERLLNQTKKYGKDKGELRMNVTFLVGNGFDLSAGIDTSYRAFYRWYCGQPSRVPEVQKLKKDISNYLEYGGETWADFEMGLAKYTEKFTVEDAESFLECYEDAHEGIIDFLEEVERSVDFNNISEEQSKQLKDGILHFYRELRPADRREIEEIITAGKTSSTKINFVSFNYTDVLDKCIENISSAPLEQWRYSNYNYSTAIGSLLHIHGSLEEYPILGVSDEAQIANKELLSVPVIRTAMIKARSVTSVGQFWYSEAEQLIDKSQIICIFGMSLGASDARWWEKIGQWLKGNSSRHLIIFWHTDRVINHRSVVRSNQEDDNVISTLANYFTLSDSLMEEIKQRIHIIYNTKSVLRIKLSTFSKVATA